jgi:hypothetical protein
MLNLLAIVFSILVVFVGLHFMWLGIKGKNCLIFYEGFVTLFLSLMFLFFYFM